MEIRLFGPPYFASRVWNWTVDDSMWSWEACEQPDGESRQASWRLLTVARKMFAAGALARLKWRHICGWSLLVGTRKQMSAQHNWTAGLRFHMGGVPDFSWHQWSDLWRKILKNLRFINKKCVMLHSQNMKMSLMQGGFMGRSTRPWVRRWHLLTPVKGPAAQFESWTKGTTQDVPIRGIIFVPFQS